MRTAAIEWSRRRAPELALAILAGLIFLGGLGSVDLWGKREQRAAAEAIDTLHADHWLVAYIQGRPRLEKPPLPRWTIAALIRLTGRSDEWVVRLPGALSALGMVALTYALGLRIAGRSAARAAGLVLCSTFFFVGEQRQAGNDGPLAFFATLALYAAWRRLHADDADVPDRLGPRRWATLMYAALGLGFLTKGPIVLIVAALTVVPYLACAGRLRSGLAALVNGPGLVLFVLLALSWPVPVVLSDPNAAQVWYLEMAQKTVSAGIKHHRERNLLALDWPSMTAPWTLIAASAIALPFGRAGRALRPRAWFAWWWAVGNLAMFCLWRVAKPNYYLPCLPGVALLTGAEWVRLARAARGEEWGSTWARRLLQAHWVLLFVAAAAAPVVLREFAPQALGRALGPAEFGWVLALSAATAAAVVACAWAWRRGSDAGAAAPLVAALALCVLVGYGRLAPAFLAAHSHRALARTLDRLLPPEVRTVMFFHQLDEGLWFYLRDRDLEPVPGSQPRYNEGFDILDDYHKNVLVWDPKRRQEIEEQILLTWLRDPERPTPYVLLRAKVYDLFAPALAGAVTPVYREHDLRRNEVVLLRATDAATAGAPAPPLR